MENVLTAIIVMFLILFGALRLSDRAISSQETLSETWYDLQEGYIETANTRFSTIDSNAGADSVTFILHNDGSTRLMDFDRWDVIVSYYDTSGIYQIEYLPFSTTIAPASWYVEGIYHDVATGRDEVFDRGIWNPGEELVVTIKQSVALGVGEAFQAVLIAPNGVGMGAVAARNTPPELLTNSPLTITVGESATITSAMLQVGDVDDITGDLIYTITTESAQGSLIPVRTFSQAQIDAGLVSYTHTGINAGNDTFEFTVSDGETTIGPYTFTITIGA